MGVHSLFLNGIFGNGIGSARPDILSDILSKFQPIEMFLQHCHYLFYARVSCHLTVVVFPNQLLSLT
jgi:hypothetical protein